MKIPTILCCLLLSTLAVAQKQIEYNVKSYGASGIKNQLATAFIQNAINECAASGGGRVYFPPGEYLSGALELKSNVTLYLEAGSVLFASQNAEDFEVPNKEDRYRHPVLIYADGAENISIEGRGKIHGQARREYRDLESVDGLIVEETEIARKSGVEMKQFYKIAPHTFLVFLVNCQNVTIRDITLYEANNWTLHTQWCNRVNIDGIYIYSSLTEGVNADGIDVDGCTNVTISNCIIETGDDAIVLKSTLSKGKSQPCENVTVTNCILTSTSTALKIGTETHSNFKHILFDNCVIRNSNRGLSIVVRDGAEVSDVKFSNITLELNRKHFNWWGNADPIWLVVLKRNENSKVGSIKNVTFDNISGYGQGTSRLEGFAGKPLENIRLNNVKLVMNPETKQDKRATHGIWAHDVNNLSMTDCEIVWNAERSEPRWASAFVFENVNNLKLNGIVASQAPFTDHPVVVLKNVQNGLAQDCITTTKTGLFFSITGKDTQKIILRNNDLPNVNQPIKISNEVNKNEVIFK